MRHLAVLGAAAVAVGLWSAPAEAVSIFSQPLLPRASSSCPANAINAATFSQAQAVKWKLTNEGVKFDHVELWGGCVRVFLAGADGSRRMVYFSSFDPLLMLY